MRIEEYTAQELFELLNELDETDSLEAKSLHEDSTRSIMESVCAFSNEPGMGGGVILLGAREAKDNALQWLRKFLGMSSALILNVAGPRESKAPGVQAKVKAFLEELLWEA